MPGEDAERLRGFLESWTRDGPWTPETPRAGESDLSLLHPEVVFEDSNLPDHAGELYRGHEGVRRATERWIEPFEWMTVELEDIIEIDERIVSIHRWQAKARETGIEFDLPLAYLWTFRDGQVTHCRSYVDPEQAISDARGEEQQA
jgi:ketosteroid isomerase-like protein